MAFSRLVFSGDVPLEEEDEAVVDTAGAADDEDACVEVTCTEDVDLVIWTVEVIVGMAVDSVRSFF